MLFRSLQNKRVLEVGSGTGWLQDMVDDYTGLDIAAERSETRHGRILDLNGSGVLHLG